MSGKQCRLERAVFSDRLDSKVIRYDCRHYRGSKPCKHKRACQGCGLYDRIESRILVIKLGALGDLLRTTPILPSLKARHPRSQVTWITQASCTPLLENLAEIDRVWVTDAHVTSRLLAERWDLMINFDKDTPAAELASLANADVKKGFGISANGALVALNEGSQYALELGVDDELKFRKNTLSYQQIIHRMADLPCEGAGPDYQLRLTDSEKAFGAEWIASVLHDRGSHRLLGVNAGTGRVFATKKWHPERYAEAVIRLHEENGVVPVLFGGSDEVELNDRLAKALRRRHVPVLRPGEDLTLRQFAAVVAQCDGFIAGDTLGMHIALALRIPTVVLFTSTCAQEIELYGRGDAVIGQADCAPCYLSKCKQASQFCADSIPVDQVVETVKARMGLGQSEELRRRSNV